MRSPDRLASSETGPGDVELAAEALARRVVDAVVVAVHVGYLLLLVLLPIGMACWFLWSCIASVGAGAWGKALANGLFVLLVSPFALWPFWVLVEGHDSDRIP
jgi:hypothetical protein